MQWASDARHQSATPVAGRAMQRIETEFVLDPFADIAEENANGNLLAHYAVPLVDGDDLFVVVKSGIFLGPDSRDSQTWNVVNLRRVNGQLVTRWSHASDWKPVPFGGGATWEPVYHPALTTDAVWTPGAGGTIDKLDRNTGAVIKRFNPFG